MDTPQKYAPDAANESPEQGTKERILKEAVRLFCEKGYPETSVREIVEAAGVTKPVLYYYFKNKDDLFLHIIHNSLIPWRERMNGICRDETRDFRMALQDITEYYLEVSQRDPELVRFIHTIAFSGLYNEIFDFQAFWMNHLENVIDLFRRGQESGIFRGDVAPDSMARIFVGICQAGMRSIVYCPQCMELPPSSRQMIDIFMRGIER